jgi:hypothetical protein
VRTVDLAGPLSCAPIAWRNGVVAPTEVGQVFLLDGSTGKSLATPFQPQLEPDRKYRWLAPVAVGKGETAPLAISDGTEHLYLVDLQAQPSPHLEAVKTVDVGPSPLVTPLAVTGTTVLAGTEDGRLARFALPELTAGEPVDLGGRVAWGPHALADGALLATDAEELIMTGPDGAIRWRRALDHGALGGKPLADGATALVLFGAGVARVNLADGAEAGYAELGQPAIAGPIALGERIVVAAPDGALLVVNRP